MLIKYLSDSIGIEVSKFERERAPSRGIGWAVGPYVAPCGLEGTERALGGSEASQAAGVW